MAAGDSAAASAAVGSLPFAACERLDAGGGGGEGPSSCLGRLGLR